jgi:hypothetical protein
LNSTGSTPPPQQQQQQQQTSSMIQGRPSQVHHHQGSTEAQQHPSILAVPRQIKAEPNPTASSVAGGSQAHAAAAAGGVDSATAEYGPAAVQLLQQAAAAGLYLPNEQQREYFKLADQPFDADELLRLYEHQLAPMTVVKAVEGRALRSGFVRQAQSVAAAAAACLEAVGEQAGAGEELPLTAAAAAAWWAAAGGGGRG